MARSLHEIRNMLENELMNCVEHPLSYDKLKLVDLLTHSMKSIDTIEDMKESGYSNAYRRYDGHSYNDMYRTDGRYSRENGRESMINHLNDMLRDASTEKEREAIRDCMNRI